MRNSKLQKSDFVTRLGEMITSAAWNNNLEEMKVLLSNPSCNVNVQNERKQTALYCASRQGHEQMVLLLLNQKQTNPNTLCNGSTALHAAAFENHASSVLLLLAAGANPDIKSSLGLVPRQETNTASIAALFELVSAEGITEALALEFPILLQLKRKQNKRLHKLKKKMIDKKSSKGVSAGPGERSASVTFATSAAGGTGRDGGKETGGGGVVGEVASNRGERRKVPLVAGLVKEEQVDSGDVSLGGGLLSAQEERAILQLPSGTCYHVGEDKCFIQRIRKERDFTSDKPHQPAPTDHATPTNATVSPASSANVLLSSTGGLAAPTTLATTTTAEPTQPTPHRSSLLPSILMRYTDALGPGTSAQAITTKSGVARDDQSEIAREKAVAMSQFEPLQQPSLESGGSGFGEGSLSPPVAGSVGGSTAVTASSTTHSGTTSQDGLVKSSVNCALEMNQSLLIISPKCTPALPLSSLSSFYESSSLYSLRHKLSQAISESSAGSLSALEECLRHPLASVLVNMLNRKGTFPLCEALLGSRHHAMACLLQNPCILVDQYDTKTGNTCLHEAIVRRDEVGFALLLAARASETIANFDPSAKTPHAILFAEGVSGTTGLQEVHHLFQQKVYDKIADRFPLTRRLLFPDLPYVIDAPVIDSTASLLAASTANLREDTKTSCATAAESQTVVTASGQKKHEKQAIVVALGYPTAPEKEREALGEHSPSMSSDDSSSESDGEIESETVVPVDEEEETEFSLSYGLSEITDFVMDYSDLSISIHFSNLNSLIVSFTVAKDFVTIAHLLSKRKSSPLPPSENTGAIFPFEPAQAMKRLGVLARIEDEEDSVSAEEKDGKKDHHSEEDLEETVQPFCVRQFKLNSLVLFDIIADSELPLVLKYYYQGGLPVLCWKAKSHNCVLRAQRPNIAIGDGLKRFAVKIQHEPEIMTQISTCLNHNDDINFLLDTQGTHPLVIADGGKVGGEGLSHSQRDYFFFNSKGKKVDDVLLLYQSLRSYNRDILGGKLENNLLFASHRKSASEDEWKGKTEWRNFVCELCTSSQTIVRMMTQGRSVLIQGAGPDFRYFDSIMSCLVLVSVDPYYRTVAGFCELLRKDWFLEGVLPWVTPPHQAKAVYNPLPGLAFNYTHTNLFDNHVFKGSKQAISQQQATPEKKEPVLTGSGPNPTPPKPQSSAFSTAPHMRALPNNRLLLKLNPNMRSPRESGGAATKSETSQQQPASGQSKGQAIEDNLIGSSFPFFLLLVCSLYELQCTFPTRFEWNVAFLSDLLSAYSHHGVEPVCETEWTNESLLEEYVIHHEDDDFTLSSYVPLLSNAQWRAKVTAYRERSHCFFREFSETLSRYSDLYKSDEFVPATASHNRNSSQHVVATPVSDHQSTITLAVPDSFHFDDWLIFHDESSEEKEKSNQQRPLHETALHQQLLRSTVLNAIDATTPEEIQARLAAAHFPFVVERMFFEYSPILRNELFFASLVRLQEKTRDESRRRRLGASEIEEKEREKKALENLRTRKESAAQLAIDLKCSRLGNSSQEGSSEMESTHEKSVVMIGNEAVEVDLAHEEVELTLKQKQQQQQREQARMELEAAEEETKRQGPLMALEAPLLLLPNEFLPFLFNFTSVTMSCRLHVLPDAFGALHHVKTLNLSNNLFARFPLVLTSLPQLTRLDLSHNFLRSIPPAITTLTALQHLHIRSNLLTDFSFLGVGWHGANASEIDSPHQPSRENQQIANSRVVVAQKKQQHAGLARNNSLQYRFGNSIFSQLSARRVKKSLVPLTQAHSHRDLSHQTNTTLNSHHVHGFHLKSLDLSHNDIKYCFANNVDFSHIVSFKLSQNPIYYIPDRFLRLFSHRCTSVDLSGCNLRLLPPHWDSLQSLTYLNLSRNKFVELPLISDCVHLKTLDLSHNKFPYFPTTIKYYQSLETLDLSSNHISVIPFWIDNLIKLKFLNLRQNQLALVSPSIAHLEALERLDLGENILTALPFSLLILSNLKHLNIVGNQNLNQYLGLSFPEVKNMLRAAKQQEDKQWSRITRTSLYVFGSQNEDQAEIVLQRLLGNKKLFKPQPRVGSPGAHNPFGVSTTAGASGGNTSAGATIPSGGGGGNPTQRSDPNAVNPVATAFGSLARNHPAAFNSEIVSEKGWCQTFTYVHPELKKGVAEQERVTIDVDVILMKHLAVQEGLLPIFLRTNSTSLIFLDFHMTREEIISQIKHWSLNISTRIKNARIIFVFMAAEGGSQEPAESHASQPTVAHDDACNSIIIECQQKDFFKHLKSVRFFSIHGAKKEDVDNLRTGLIENLLGSPYKIEYRSKFNRFIALLNEIRDQSLTNSCAINNKSGEDLVGNGAKNASTNNLKTRDFPILTHDEFVFRANTVGIQKTSEIEEVRDFLHKHLFIIANYQNAPTDGLIVLCPQWLFHILTTFLTYAEILSQFLNSNCILNVGEMRNILSNFKLPETRVMLMCLAERFGLLQTLARPSASILSSPQSAETPRDIDTPKLSIVSPESEDRHFFLKGILPRSNTLKKYGSIMEIIPSQQALVDKERAFLLSRRPFLRYRASGSLVVDANLLNDSSSSNTSVVTPLHPSATLTHRTTVAESTTIASSTTAAQVKPEEPLPVEKFTFLNRIFKMDFFSNDLYSSIIGKMLESKEMLNPKRDFTISKNSNQVLTEIKFESSVATIIKLQLAAESPGDKYVYAVVIMIEGEEETSAKIFSTFCSCINDVLYQTTISEQSFFFFDSQLVNISDFENSDDDSETQTDIDASTMATVREGEITASERPAPVKPSSNASPLAPSSSPLNRTEQPLSRYLSQLMTKKTLMSQSQQRVLVAGQGGGGWIDSTGPHRELSESHTNLPQIITTNLTTSDQIGANTGSPAGVNNATALTTASPEQLTRFLSHLMPEKYVSEYRGPVYAYQHVHKLRHLGTGGFAEVYSAYLDTETVRAGQSDQQQPKKCRSRSNSASEALKSDAETHRTTSTLAESTVSTMEPVPANRTEYAVKELTFSNYAAKKTKSMQRHDQFKLFRQEILTHASLSHPSILGLVGVTMKPLCLIMELCAFGDLDGFTRAWTRPFPYQLKLKFARDIIEGIKYLQELTPPVAHLDIKSANILLSATDLHAPVCCKIADFGTAQRVATPIIVRYVDNPTWLAPEILLGLPYDVKVDTYALGTVLWEIVTRKRYLSDVDSFDITNSILSRYRPEIPSFCLPGLDSIITSCWSQNALDRPRMCEVLAVLDSIPESLIRTYQEQNAAYDAQLLLKAKKEELKQSMHDKKHEKKSSPRTALKESKLSPRSPTGHQVLPSALQQSSHNPQHRKPNALTDSSASPRPVPPSTPSPTTVPMSSNWATSALTSSNPVNPSPTSQPSTRAPPLPLTASPLTNSGSSKSSRAESSNSAQPSSHLSQSAGALSDGRTGGAGGPSRPSTSLTGSPANSPPTQQATRVPSPQQCVSSTTTSNPLSLSQSTGRPPSIALPTSITGTNSNPSLLSSNSNSSTPPPRPTVMSPTERDRSTKSVPPTVQHVQNASAYPRRISTDEETLARERRKSVDRERDESPTADSLSKSTKPKKSREKTPERPASGKHGKDESPSDGTSEKRTHHSHHVRGGSHDAAQQKDQQQALLPVTKDGEGESKTRRKRSKSAGGTNPNG